MCRCDGNAIYIGYEASLKLRLKGCVVSVCCVGCASQDVVCDELYACVWNVGLQQLSDCVCMFIVSKALLILSATVIARTWRAIFLSPYPV